MPLPNLRDPAEILKEWQAASPQEGDAARALDRFPGLPEDYTRALRSLGQFEAAADFRFLDPRTAILENTHRDHPLVALGTKWWIFATSGTGDGWLIQQLDPPGEVAFLDSDQERDARPAPLGIDFLRWLQLADLNRQLERSGSGSSISVPAGGLVPAIRAAFSSALEELSPQLLAAYPYSY